MTKFSLKKLVLELEKELIFYKDYCNRLVELGNLPCLPKDLDNLRYANTEFSKEIDELKKENSELKQKLKDVKI